MANSGELSGALQALPANACYLRYGPAAIERSGGTAVGSLAELDDVLSLRAAQPG